MPVFELQGPDGATYEIDAPDENAAFNAFKAVGSKPAAQANAGGLEPRVQDYIARAKARVESGAPIRPPNSLAPGAPVHSEFDPARVPPRYPMLDKVGAFSMSGLEGIPIAGPSFKNVTLDIAGGLGHAISGQ
ncbi:MAG: hypothetical protein EOQ93_31450, partial [Mesorhizobium sp.]